MEMGSSTLFAGFTISHATTWDINVYNHIQVIYAKQKSIHVHILALYTYVNIYTFIYLKTLVYIFSYISLKLYIYICGCFRK